MENLCGTKGKRRRFVTLSRRQIRSAPRIGFRLPYKADNSGFLKATRTSQNTSGIKPALVVGSDSALTAWRGTIKVGQWKRTNVLRISVDWFEGAHNAAREERATACDFRVWITNQNVCLHVDGIDGAVYDHVTMPAYSLAEGLAHDWWTIFGSRDKEYQLIRHRMGYTTHDVRFKFDGVAFETYSCQHSYSNPGTRFWTGPTELMSRSVAESTLAGFIDQVITRLHEANLHGTSADLRWARVQASRLDHDETEFCEAAGALGVDPYSIGEEETDFITQSAALFNDEPRIEFLAGVPRPSLRGGTLDWIRYVESRPPYQSRLPDLASVADQVCRATLQRSGDRSWALGYRRAGAARAVLNKKQSDRISSTGELARALGNKSIRSAGRTSGLRALVSLFGGNVHVHLRDRPRTPEARVSELFAFTRAVGDAICFPGTPRAVVNELHYADRQAAARAFAAEFLAPINEILSMREDDKDIATIADEFNVSTELVELQLVNRERIAKACDQEEQSNTEKLSAG